MRSVKYGTKPLYFLNTPPNISIRMARATKAKKYLTIPMDEPINKPAFTSAPPILFLDA